MYIHAHFYEANFLVEGDIVLLRSKHNASAKPILTKPLEKNAILQTYRGTISHSQLIGARVRDNVFTNAKIGFRIHEPTLAEYVKSTPRIVTPVGETPLSLGLIEGKEAKILLFYQIYPGDASFIVSLLDIHVSAPGEIAAEDPPLEILEAGTGHGALTLYLAQAVHGANTKPPNMPSLAQASHQTNDNNSNSAGGGDDTTAFRSSGQGAADLFQQWKQSRHAIVHTLDVSQKHSRHAEKIIRNFRRGLYYGDVDFHVGDLTDWIAAQVASRQNRSLPDSDNPSVSGERRPTPFLAHALLDLPSAEAHISEVASVLQSNGILTVFNPSITQIIECVERVKAERLPLVLDKVVELETGRSEGKIWDVRATKTRAMERRTSEDDASESDAASEVVEDANESSDSESESSELVERDSEQASDLRERGKEYVMVCRPKVGSKIVGGGFLGMWRKMS